MRVIGGMWKGQILAMPSAKLTRPTSNRARQAIFNVIEHNFASFEDSLIADLCAGSGAMGIEALSRGAQHATFVENNSHVAQVLLQNITKFKAKHQSLFLRNSITNLSVAQHAYHYIFFDPPYNLDLEKQGIKQLIQKNWLSPNTIVCLETESTSIPNSFDGLIKVDERRYGRAGFSFWKQDQTKIS